MTTQIQLKRDTAANWTSANPTLAAGEVGWESDTHKFKVGDGATAWTGLSYFTSGGGITQAYGGKSTVGASFEAMTSRRILLKKITLTAAALVSDVQTYLKGSSNVHGFASGLWADSSGAPGDLLAASAFPPASSLYLPNTTGQWFGQPIGRWCPAGDYWIGCQFRTSSALNVWQIAYDGSGTDRAVSAATVGGDWIEGIQAGASTATTNNYSIRANLLT